MYHSGENVNAVVIDIGSANARIGCAGYDAPEVRLSSQFLQETVVGDSSSLHHHLLDEQSLYRHHPMKEDPRSTMSVERAVTHGLVSNWSAIELLLDHALERMGLSNKYMDHPTIVTEPAFTPRQDRLRWTELMFEQYDVPAFGLAKSPVLSCYAQGRTSGLVLDCGAGQTSVTPVSDGLALPKYVAKTPNLSGDVLDAFLAHQLATGAIARIPESKRSFVPGPVKDNHGPPLRYIPALCEYHYHVNARGLRTTTCVQPPTSMLTTTPTTTSSVVTFGRLERIREIKALVCRVSDVPFDASSNAQIPKVPYELPDGTILPIGTERFEIPEQLFVSSSLPRSHVVKKSSSSTKKKKKSKLNQDDDDDYHHHHHPSLQELVVTSANACDVELRRELLQNIVLAGGASGFENLNIRLEREVSTLVPPAFKIKVVSSTPSERSTSAWVGGSILASLGSWHEMWMSKSEYAEHGAGLIMRKCP